MTRALARVVPYAAGRCVALPVHTTLEIVEHPKAVPVPGGAHHARGLLAWQGRRIPLIDLRAMLHGRETDARVEEPRYALVVAWQDVPGQSVQHGAIALDALPGTVSVQDAQRCALPRDSELWSRISVSCFRLDGEPVPVVDTARLFR